MALNLRGRAAGVDPVLAGNYETTLPYLRGDAATPVAIRRSLMNPERLRRVSDAPFPNWWHSLYARATVVTNWSGFFAELQLPESVFCRHTPVIDLRVARTNMVDIYIIFSPRAGAFEVFAQTRNPRVTPSTFTKAFAV